MQQSANQIRRRNRLLQLFPRASTVWYQFRFLSSWFKKWETTGFSAPLPPLLKRAVIRKKALDYHCTALVETGTYVGDTPWYLRDVFQEIHTIEVSPMLAQLATQRFANFPHIHTHEGDSGKLLPEIVAKLTKPTLFWLDGHYSGGATSRAGTDTPICAELETIFQLCKVPYILLIDDARNFGTDNDYPTLDFLRDFISSRVKNLQVTVENDIIFVVPKP